MRLTIETLSTCGEGIARVDGKATFVPFTLPGETWDVESVSSKKNYDRALPVRQIENSYKASCRVEPQCPYFGTCGGCQLQHIDYRRQLELKRDWLIETFRRVGHLEIGAKPTADSPPWEYRNKLTVPLHIRNGAIAYGFHQVYLPNRLTVIDDCRIAHAKIRQVMPGVLDALNQCRPEIQRPSRKNPQASQIVFRVIESKVIVQFSGLRFTPDRLERLLDSLENNESQLDEFLVTDASSEETHYKLDDENDKPAIHPEAFLQVNDAVREKIYDAVLNLPFQGRDSILDGYCGVGLLTQRLSTRFQNVTGVESNRISSEEAALAIQRQNLQNRVRIYQQTLESYLQQTNERFETVLLNPPRAGLSPKARERIIQRHPDEIAMVSCHPAALARDVKALVDAGYEIRDVQPFDMFPQTYHLETLVYLR